MKIPTITTMPRLTKIEVWVERDVLEIVVSAAMEYSCHWPFGFENGKQLKVVAAVEALQAAVKRNDFDAPLDINRL